MVQLVKERYTPLLDLLTFHYVNIEKHLGLAKLNTIEVNETTGVTSMAKVNTIKGKNFSFIYFQLLIN